jgi:uncharacterized protein YjbI with pentapeptide repeats
MANAEHLAKLDTGKEQFHEWRTTQKELLDFVGADLQDRDFSGWNLSDVHFARANLKGANLRGANLSGTNFVESDLSKGDLTDAICARCFERK